VHTNSEIWTGWHNPQLNLNVNLTIKSYFLTLKITNLNLRFNGDFNLIIEVCAAQSCVLIQGLTTATMKSSRGKRYGRHLESVDLWAVSVSHVTRILL
jgi:hypothetical protein